MAARAAPGGAQRAAHRPAARRGHAARAEIGRDEHRVAVDPAQRPLGERTLEAALDEGPGLEIELARDRRVAPARRQIDEAAAVVGAQARRALPHPLRAFGLVDRVEVEHHVPRRVRLAVLVGRGAAPDAALVVAVLPEVVEVRADLHNRRDARVGVEDRSDRLLEGLEAVVGGERLGRAHVLLAHPRERAVALHVFKPEIGVVGNLVHRRDARR